MENTSDKLNTISNKVPTVIKWAVLLLLVTYFGFGTWLFVFQRDYLYFPDTTAFKDCPAFIQATQISYGSTRSYFTKRSQEKLIVYYHGDDGRACDRQYLDSFFATNDYSTLFVEYSGYAEKAEKPYMTDILKNVTDTVDFLKTQDFKNIVVIGESLGVGPAAYHAMRADIAKLILITPYDNINDVASYYYPLYYMRQLLLNNFTPDEWLAHYNGLVEIILAGNDELIPARFSKKLYDAIPSPLKKMYTVTDAGHDSIYNKDEFFSLLGSLLQ